MKRLQRPELHADAVLTTIGHPWFWCREALVAANRTVASTPGMVSAPLLDLVEDDEGFTLVHAYVEDADVPGLALARCMGEFATAPLPAVRWLTRDLLATRLASVERRGGWTTLARTPVADVADALWRRRAGHLERMASLPQVLQHGDPVPSNLRALDATGRVVAIDWATLGTGPVGGDLGYLALSVKESFDPLLEAYLRGYLRGIEASGGETPVREDVAFAARAVAVFTVLTRADWALARAAAGEGALAGKFRHPSVSPALLAMQRQYPLIEALLGT